MARIHFVPHTHWDREWYLPFQVFRIKLVHLMDRLLNILSTNAAYTHFVLDGQAILLEDYLAVRPDALVLIRDFVRSGRLHIGPWYVLPDEFLVSPEALIRNLLRGREACKPFGKPMSVGYVPDPFGHIGQLPQILNGFGIHRAAFRRGLSEEPVELYWSAAAGSSVLVSYLRDGYDNAARAPEEIEAFHAFIRNRVGSLIEHMQSTQALLLNGTDHHEPQRAIPELIAAARLDDEIQFSNLEQYFESLEEEIQRRSLKLPMITGDLRDPRRHHLLPGVLSSRVWIKQRNHECETILERWAEPFTVWASLLVDEPPDRHLWTGHIATPLVQHPEALLDEAWRLLLTCHPHDSICGCSIDQVHDEMHPRFDNVAQIGNEVTRQSLSVIAQHVDTHAFKDLNCRAALIVFNAAPTRQTGVAAANLELSAGLDPFQIVDEEGRKIPYRIVNREARSLADLELDGEGLSGMLAFVNEGEVMGLAIQDAAVIQHPDHTLIDVTVAENAPANVDLVEALIPEIEALITAGSSDQFRLVARFASKIEIEFLAGNIPPIGYSSFGLRSSDEQPAPEVLNGTPIIRNEFLELELSDDGSLKLYDLRNQRIYAQLCRLKDQADCGDSYTFCPLDGEVERYLEVRVMNVSNRQDALGSRLDYELKFELPEGLTGDRSARSQMMIPHSVSVAARLLRDVARVDLQFRIENKARDHRLKLTFPTKIPTQQAVFDTHFAWIERPTSPPESDENWAEAPVPEQPMRRFVAVHNDYGGLMIAGRGLREASVNPDGEIGITLLRSFGWLSRDDLSTRKGGAGPEIRTPGGQEVGGREFHLAMIPIDADFTNAAALADQFQTTMTGFASPLQDGSQPQSTSLVAADQAGFEISAVKPANDGNGFIVRGVNLSGREETVQLDLGIPIESAVQTRMDESALGPLHVEAASRVEFKPNVGEVVTIRIIPA